MAGYPGCCDVTSKSCSGTSPPCSVSTVLPRDGSTSAAQVADPVLVGFAGPATGCDTQRGAPQGFFCSQHLSRGCVAAFRSSNEHHMGRIIFHELFLYDLVCFSLPFTCLACEGPGNTRRGKAGLLSKDCFSLGCWGFRCCA